MISHRFLPWRLTCTLAVAGLLLTAGCSGGSGLKTAKVTGKVTYNGAALSEATISFVPQAQDGKPAGGTTDQQGNYTLTTMDAGAKFAEGVLAGSYKVLITKAKKSPDEEFRERINSMTPEEMQNLSDEDKQKMGRGAGAVDPNQQPGAAAAPESAIPTKYGSLEETPLTATVAAGQSQPVNFDLTD
jgi:hypothetical protein